MGPIVHLRHCHRVERSWLRLRLPCLVCIFQLACLLGHHHFFHLLDRNCALDVDPLVLDHVFLLQLQHKVHTANVAVGHKAKAARLVSPLVLQDDTVLDHAEVFKVGSEVAELKVVGQTANEHFSELCVDLIAARQGLLPKLFDREEFFFVLQELLSCEGLTHWHFLLERVNEFFSFNLNGSLLLVAHCAAWFPLPVPHASAVAHQPVEVRIAGLIMGPVAARFKNLCLVAKFFSPVPERLVLVRVSTATAPLDIVLLVQKQFVCKRGNFRIDVVLLFFLGALAHVKLFRWQLL